MTINKSKQKSEIVTLLENKPRSKPEGNFRVSFADLDTSQKFGSAFADWQKDGLLSHAMEVLRGYCKRPLEQQIDGDKFTIYGDWPKKSLFIRPPYIIPDAKWARIHVNGKSVLAGHVIRNTFYLVFLDKTHGFYQTERDGRTR